MRGMPPLPIRRAVVAPVVLAVEVLLVLVSPLLLMLAVLASPLFGRWRPLRMLTIVLSFVVHHAGASVACLWLWVTSGFGRRLTTEPEQRAHYAVLRWFVAGIYAAIVRLAHVDVRVSESCEAEEVLSTPQRPVVVFARHAGEGDTLLVVEHLIGRYNRWPRVVMNEALRLDPLIDVLGHRLPNRFVDPRGGDTEVEIAAMASDLDDRSAVGTTSASPPCSSTRPRVSPRASAERAASTRLAPIECVLLVRELERREALGPAGAAAAEELDGVVSAINDNARSA